jgi:fructose-specific phosphotransferase system IIC component
VIFVVDNRLMYVVAIAAGVAVTAVVTNLVKQLTTTRQPSDALPAATAAAV